MHGSFGRRKHRYTYTLLLLFKMIGQQGSHSVLLISFFVCYWGVRSFLQRHFHFTLTWDFFFYCCSVESRSNLKILHNSNTVTTQFICGSWKPGNTAYFFHPVLQNPFYCFCHLFWESTFIQMYYLLVPMFKGNYFYSWNISLS